MSAVNRAGRIIFALAVTVVPRTASAHAGSVPEPHDAWTAWGGDPLSIAFLLGLALLYARGRARSRSLPRSPASVLRARLFTAGWVATAIALVSPVDALGGVLLSGHMVQHELLMVVAAPLLVIARPVASIMKGLPRAVRRLFRHAGPATRRIRGSLLDPVTATGLHAAAVWVWHHPSLFGATLTSDLAHASQHAAFFGTAILFWWSLLRARRSAAVAVLCLFATMVQTTVLAMLLTFAPEPWYTGYGMTGAWGITALEDQQIAGLVMWVPGSLSYLLVLWVVVGRLLETRADPPIFTFREVPGERTR